MDTNENNSTTGSVQVQRQAAPKSSLGIPIAIVLAAALVAGAIVFTGSQKSATPIQIGGAGADTTKQAQKTPDAVIAPVTDKDHVRGNPNAPIVIIEYSDFECPYCKNFHETMNRIMAEYGKTGKVAWVYRSYPIIQLHPNAPKIAEAAECVSSLGGNEAFWKFADQVFGEREVNAQTDITKLPTFAEKAGVDKTKFSACVAAGTFKDAVQASIVASQNAGAQGTPYSILMAGNQQGPINGAQPYETVKGMIDTTLSQLGG